MGILITISNYHESTISWSYIYFLGYLKLGKFFAFLWVFFSLPNDQQKVLGKHEWYSFSSDTKFLFEMSQEVSKINVKDLPIFADHYIIRMSVANAKNECGDTITSTAQSKSLNRLFKLSFATLNYFHRTKSNS